MFIQSISSTKEWNAAASYECESHPHRPTCIFGDISHFFTPAIRVKLDDFRNGSMLESKLMPMVISGVAVQTILGWVALKLWYVMLCCDRLYVVSSIQFTISSFANIIHPQAAAGWAELVVVLFLTLFDIKLRQNILLMFQVKLMLSSRYIKHMFVCYVYVMCCYVMVLPFSQDWSVQKAWQPLWSRRQHCTTAHSRDSVHCIQHYGVAGWRRCNELCTFSVLGRTARQTSGTIDNPRVHGRISTRCVRVTSSNVWLDGRGCKPRQLWLACAATKTMGCVACLFWLVFVLVVLCLFLDIVSPMNVCLDYWSFVEIFFCLI